MLSIHFQIRCRVQITHTLAMKEDVWKYQLYVIIYKTASTVSMNMFVVSFKLKGIFSASNNFLNDKNQWV